MVYNLLVEEDMQRKRRSNDIRLISMCYVQCFVYTYCVYVYAIDSESASKIGSERQMRGDGDDSVSSGRKRGPEVSLVCTVTLNGLCIVYMYTLSTQRVQVKLAVRGR